MKHFIVSFSASFSKADVHGTLGIKADIYPNEEEIKHFLKSSYLDKGCLEGFKLSNVLTVTKKQFNEYYRK